MYTLKKEYAAPLPAGGRIRNSGLSPIDKKHSDAGKPQEKHIAEFTRKCLESQGMEKIKIKATT